MLRPAAVTAAAVWLLVLLGTGLTSAEAASETDFTLCSHSFYRQSPPQGSSDRPLRPLCHTRPGGQTFATLYQPSCGSAVYSAFLLNNELATSTAEDGPEPVSKEEESVTVVVPALLKGDSEEPELSPAASHLQQWDSAVSALVQSDIAPRCRTLGGDLYVLIGAGQLGALGGEECQTKLLWSAACCAVPEGKDAFSVAFIRETEEEERQVTVEELVGLLGVTELFSGGCGEDGQSAAAFLGSTSPTVNVAVSEAVSEDEEIEKVNSHNSEQTPDKVESSEQALSSSEAQVTSEEKTAVTESATRYQVSPDSDEGEVSPSEDPSPAETQIEAGPETQIEADSSVTSETVEEQEADKNSTSALLYILSTALAILKAPLHPVMSTITQLPGQVSYVLQEDLGVLSALPGDTYSVFHLLVSDVFSWIGSVVDLVLGVGEACFSRIYYCTSSMGEALLTSCCTGVTGMGALAGDTVGIFGGVLNNTWWVTKFFGGRLVEQSGDYVGTVVGELGGQACAVGCGVGRLLCKIGSCVWKVFKFGWRIFTGVIYIILAIMGDAFERESVRNEETVDTSVL